MDTEKLKKAEALFLDRYPGGFAHPDIAAIGKKHKMDAMIEFAQTEFAKEKFDQPNRILESAVKLMGRSSMISMFEKPKYKEFVAALSKDERTRYLAGLYNALHGKKKEGFTGMVTVLEQYKLAKWPLATAIQAYYRPKSEVFVKPNTTKMVIAKLGIDLDYHPRPTWAFYSGYKKAVAAMKKEVSSDLAPSNAAFIGFLMMTLEEV